MIELKTNNLSKNFDQTQALKQVSVTLAGGKMHGLIGPEGAGKTTLLRLLTQLLIPTHGEILYIKDNSPITFDAIKSEWAYMPQTQSLYSDLSIKEHLEFFRELYSLESVDYEKKKEDLLHLTRLKSFEDRPAGKLSGGMYKKLGLMCSLLRNPKVLILDEPTNGVDPISRREFWELLHELNEITIVVATAYMDEAERCENVILLENGKILESGEPQLILENNKSKNFNDFFIQRTGAING